MSISGTLSSDNFPDYITLVLECNILKKPRAGDQNHESHHLLSMRWAVVEIAGFPGDWPLLNDLRD